MHNFIAAFRRMRLLGPTLFTLVAIIALVSLGAWQWQRKVWKEGLLRQLQDAQKAEPLPLSALLNFKNPDDIRFRRVRLTGRFLHDYEIHMWLPGAKGTNWRIITPLELDKKTEGGTDIPAADMQTLHLPTHVLVIRGIVGNAYKLYAARPEVRASSSSVSLTARVRFDSANWATPEPDREANRWYALHNGQMAAALTARLPSAAIAPFFVEAEVATAAQPAPQPNLQQLRLHNRHLEYALTWWSLALTLFSVYAVFIGGRLRQTKC